MSKKYKKDLSKRDIELLIYCFEQYFLSRDQIKAWFTHKHGIKNSHSLRTIIPRYYFQHKKLIETHRLADLDYVPLTSLSRRGVKALKEFGAIPSEASYESFPFLKYKHDHTAADVRLLLEKILPIDRWTPDRFLKSEMEYQIPDGVMQLYSAMKGDYSCIAIEVELTRKSKYRYIDKFRFYKFADEYDCVYYFVDDEKLHKLIFDLAAEMTKKVYVTYMDELLAHEHYCVMEHKEHAFILNELLTEDLRDKTYDDIDEDDDWEFS